MKAAVFPLDLSQPCSPTNPKGALWGVGRVWRQVRATLIGLFRDLRGIANSTNSRRTYGLLFDWLYPTHMPLLLRAVEAWADTPAVTTPVLKFMAEFVLNKTQVTKPSPDPGAAGLGGWRARWVTPARCTHGGAEFSLAPIVQKAMSAPRVSQPVAR
jgi:hypothetical protein